MAVGLKKQKLYISGKITGDDNYVRKFLLAEHLAKKLGFKPVNPIKGEKKNKPWSYYMRRDVAKLAKCDAILLIYDWAMSRGARIERRLALDLGLEVYYFVESYGGHTITKEASECETTSED